MAKENIYIYKVAVGTNNAHLCKIGKSMDDAKRMEQHSRTPYYIFPPYLSFETNKPIYAAFTVTSGDAADTIIKDVFNDSDKLTGLEVYDLDYDEAVHKLALDQRIAVVAGDEHSVIVEKDVPGVDDTAISTKKADFQQLIDNIMASDNAFKIKALGELTRPLPTPNWLASNGNFITVGDRYLSLNFNKVGRMQVLQDLKEIADNNQ
ncbi:MAG: hypothetical protein LBM12_00265 [Candidatus Nomurabacteria bacterium]|jgi:hypothetical protein|nr:hypothetical protein [Candidatus Nomurabacteria bacterium]